MMIRWINKKVNLSYLVERVCLFFEANGFKTKMERLKDGWMVLAIRSFDGRFKCVSVKVLGQPDDFTIDFSFEGNRRGLRLLWAFGALFGLGAFFLKDLEWMGFFKALENDFWAYIEREIAENNL